ncbi:MAG: hypothetical protein M3O61_16030 [Gemmatimonadota bacterium]|nr:hypothetical protein [Gemmatimonadota bacterium]
MLSDGQSTESAERNRIAAGLEYVPIDYHDSWRMSDERLGELVASDLAHAGIPLSQTAAAVHVKRLRHAYPIYLKGY